ncbi:hypothetical protein LTR65_005827 [Meristemomyces frigidus]
MTESTSQPSVFQPHHRTSIVYPCVELLQYLDLPLEACVLIPVANSKDRYEPGRIIEDEAVAIHSSREGHAAVAIVVNTAATGRHAVEILEQRTTQFNAFLWKDQMWYIQQYAGETALQAVTFREAGVDKLTIERSTCLRGEDGQLRPVQEITYTMDLEDFELAAAGEPRSMWVKDLMDLLHRRTDRAVLHVRHQLQGHQPEEERIADISTVWKA